MYVPEGYGRVYQVGVHTSYQGRALATKLSLADLTGLAVPGRVVPRQPCAFSVTEPVHVAGPGYNTYVS